MSQTVFTGESLCVGGCSPTGRFRAGDLELLSETSMWSPIKRFRILNAIAPGSWPDARPPRSAADPRRRTPRRQARQHRCLARWRHPPEALPQGSGREAACGALHARPHPDAVNRPPGRTVSPRRPEARLRGFTARTQKACKKKMALATGLEPTT